MVSARLEKDQRWVEGVLSSWEDMRGDEREGEEEKGGIGGWEGFNGGEGGEFDGYLSEPWTGDHHNAVDKTF